MEKPFFSNQLKTMQEHLKILIKLPMVNQGNDYATESLIDFPCFEEITNWLT